MSRPRSTARTTADSTAAPVVTPRRPGDPEPDLRLYHLIHVAMTGTLVELADVAERMQAAGHVEPEQATAFRTYVRYVVDEIERHHQGEDNVGWPIIVASAGDAVDLAPLTGDHEELDPLLHHLRAVMDSLVSEVGSHLVLCELAAVLRDIRDLLVEHIDEEEREIFPIIRTYVSREDHHAWEAEMKKELPMGDAWFVCCWAAAAADPIERPALLKEAGVPFRIMYALTRRRYEKLHARATYVA